MNVVAVQLDIVWENQAANHDKVRRLLASVSPGSLIVLPEMFATGFSMNAASDTGEFLPGLAREHRSHVLAGIVRDRQNQAVLVDPQGREVARYAKVHLFSYANENDHFVAGTEPVVAPCGEFQLAPTICYDLRFPELFRAGMKRGANLFAIIANWPTPRRDHWLTLLKARAIENQSYVIGVNRCGRDPNAAYSGDTQIINPRGEVLADGGENEGVVRAELDLPALQAYRSKFPALQDMR